MKTSFLDDEIPLSVKYPPESPLPRLAYANEWSTGLVAGWCAIACMVAAWAFGDFEILFLAVVCVGFSLNSFFHVKKEIISAIAEEKRREAVSAIATPRKEIWTEENWGKSQLQD